MKHLMKYQFLQLIRGRGTMFWAAIFPIILGTLMYVTIGSGTSESEMLKEIPVAVLIEQDNEAGKAFVSFLDQLDGDVIAVRKIEHASEAKKELLEGDITGIYYVGAKQRLTVSKSGLTESILESLLDTYIKHEAMVLDIMKNHPENLPAAMESMESYRIMTKEVSLGGRTLSGNINYYFALLAMACLYGSFIGLDTAFGLQANLSALAARRGVTPTHRMRLIVSDFLVTFGVHFANIIVLLCYLKFVLKVEFGDRWGYMLLICLVGSMLGVAFGILIGSISKKSENFKSAVLVGASMICSFLAGLMVGTMKDIVEKYAPLVNRINPAALIADAFYCVNVYDDMERYYRNFLTLVVMTVVCVGASFMIVRRNRYDSI